MTEVTQGKQNRLGSKCPPWCATDHDEALVAERPGHPAIYAEAHTGRIHNDGRDGPWADVVQVGWTGITYGDPRPYVFVGGTGGIPFPNLDLAGALALAALLEVLAGADADQVRAFAGELRQCADVIGGPAR